MNRASLEALKIEFRQHLDETARPRRRMLADVAYQVLESLPASHYLDGLIAANARFGAPARVAVGGRRRGPDDFLLVLRLQSDAPAETATAEAFAERVGRDEIDIATIDGLRADAAGPCFGACSIRPLELGYSIGHKHGEPGTLGAFVEHEGAVGILSANHVLGLLNAAKIRDPIIQPGRADASRIEEIGALRAVEPLQFHPRSRNRVDVALASLNDGVDHRGNILPRASGAKDGGRPLAGVTDVESLEEADGRLAKIGRTTGYQSAPLDRVTIGIDNIEIYFGLVPARFEGLIEVEWETDTPEFAAEGDSGCVYYLEHDRHVVGLHIGSGSLIRNGRRTRVSYGCSFERALACVGGRLLI